MVAAFSSWDECCRSSRPIADASVVLGHHPAVRGTVSLGDSADIDTDATAFACRLEAEGLKPVATEKAFKEYEQAEESEG